MDHLNDARNWRRFDPRPGQPLTEIEPFAERATALIARSSAAVLNEHFVQITSAVTILSGIEYHYARYCEETSRLRPPREGDNHFGPLLHEAVAWLNRVGQFAAFVKSPLAQTVSQATPTIDSLQPFRNKHSAHRSIDAPRKDDTADLMIGQAISMSDLGGQIWTRRTSWAEVAEDAPDEEFVITPENHFVGFQMATKDGLQHLFVERDSPTIAMEAYSVFEALVA